MSRLTSQEADRYGYNDFKGNIGRNFGDPANDNDAATKAYTDTEVQGAKAYTDTEVDGYIPIDGWVASSDTWTYSSADAPTYVITVPSDATTKYSAGMRIKLTQPTDGVKYFIVTAVSATSLTVYGGTDYDLDNESITAPYYSTQKAPFGFPLDPTKWTVTTIDTSLQQQSSPTSGIWYNLGSVGITIPIGSWNVDYNVSAGARLASGTSVDLYVTLSTANNSESDTQFSAYTRNSGATADIRAYQEFSIRKHLLLATKTAYYLNTKTGTSSITYVFNFGDLTPTIIRAVCAYL